jgi:hypothetical protein
VLTPPLIRKINKNIPMTSRPVFGKLFISLCPNDGEVKKYGTHRKHQLQIIFQLIEELGFNTQVYIEPAIWKAMPGRIQIVPKYLHQCVHLLYLTDFIIIPNTPEVTSPQLYRHTLTKESSLTTIFLTSRKKHCV